MAESRKADLQLGGVGSHTARYGFDLKGVTLSIPFAKRVQIFLPFAMGYFLSYLYRVINSVLAPNLAADIGVDPSGLGMGIFLSVLVLIIFPYAPLAPLLWILFGFFGTSGILPYAALSQSFPLHLSGRANTALNLLVFVGAFAAQWGIGAIIEQWPVTEAGRYAPAGYQVAFSVLVILQLLAMLWFWLAGRLMEKRASMNPMVTTE
ncbi:MAG: hypothetical protein U5R49_13705 [Deltaproteobacteria bacterium]|nr:hypothetical protein [Deltaproteobacteria bacterium]